MKSFRLPRKTKKRLGKTLWLYPPDEEGNSLMAHPEDNQEDYDALKSGEVRNAFTKSRIERKTYWQKLDKEIYVEDKLLRSYVDEVFAIGFRQTSFDILVRARRYGDTRNAYFNFVNAYHLHKQGEDDYFNTCCMAVDRARHLLKVKASGRKPKRRS